MPLPSLIKTGLSTLLSDIFIEDSSKAINLLKEHFTFRADEITKGYQDSYGYAITAITVGLAAPDQKLAFIQKMISLRSLLRFSILKSPVIFQTPLKPSICNHSPNSAATLYHHYANN